MIERVLKTVSSLSPFVRGRYRLMRLATRLGALPRPGVYRVAPGIAMQIDPKTYLERALYFAAFETALRRVLQPLMGPGATFVDVGANVGYYSLVAARRGCRVLAIEPNPRTAARLRENVALNACADVVTVLELGLGGRDSQLNLYTPRQGDPALASLAPGQWEDPWTVAVPIRRLDDVVPDGMRVSLIKIDVEGAEPGVVAGGLETIRRHRPTLVVEANREAATRFGCEPDAAARLVLDRIGGYRVGIVDYHRLRWLGRDEPLAGRPELADCNLILAPDE